VTNPTIVQAMVKKNNETLAEGQIFVPINKALNKPVTEGTQPHEQYTAQGLSSLTDGKLGTTSFKSPNWIGYLDSVVTVVIDLETVQKVSSVDLNCLSDANSGIFLPRNVKVYASDNGTDYSMLKDFRVKEISKRGEPYLYPVKVGGVATSVRYLKLEIQTFGQIPEGYLFKGTNSWLFIDEVLVE